MSNSTPELDGMTSELIVEQLHPEGREMNRITDERSAKTAAVAYETFTAGMYVAPWERLPDYQKERWRRVAVAVSAKLALTSGQLSARVAPIQTPQRREG